MRNFLNKNLRATLLLDEVLLVIITQMKSPKQGHQLPVFRRKAESIASQHGHQALYHCAGC